MLAPDANVSSSRFALLTKRLQVRFGRWPAVIAGLLAALAVFMLVDALPTDPVEATRITRVEIAPADSATRPPVTGDPVWQSAVWWEVGHRQELSWVRAHVWVQEPDAGPLAVRLSGVFSAEVWINGVPAGSKGSPAVTAEDEVSGPIDALIPAGASLMAGENEILLLVSANRAGYAPARLIQDFDLVARSGPARRELSHYLPALLQAGLTALILIYSATQAMRRDSSDAALWCAVAAGCLLAALGAEAARAFVNYPYPWHGVRVGGIALAHAGFALSLTLAAGGAAGSRRWIPAAVAVIAFAGLALTLALPGLGGFDTAARIALAAGLSAAALRLSRRTSLPVLVAAGVCLACAGLAVLSGRTFLDNGIYTLGPVVLILLLTGRARVAHQPAEPVLRLPDLARALKIRDISYLQARGNYVEIHLVDRAAPFVRASLSEVMHAANPYLIRIHRSYAVNPDRALKVEALEGSRYRLLLDTGEALPVSRNRAAELRAQLAAAPRQA